jgi:hypothetical protein
MALLGYKRMQSLMASRLHTFRFVTLVADRYFCQDPATPAFAAEDARLFSQMAPSIGGCIDNVSQGCFVA